MIPMAVERYEIGFGVLPLPTTTTTTSTTTPTAFPTTPEEHAALLNSAYDDIPTHLALQFNPKLLRDGSAVRMYQWRYDDQQRKFCWQTFAQPLRPPTTTKVNPQLRISCPGLDKKLNMDEIIHFLRYYNTRENGSYYKSTPEKMYDGHGFGPNGLTAPSTDG